jgi:hypothetical protein
VHFAGLCSRIPFVAMRQECARNPPNAHSLGRYVQQQKMKKSDSVVAEKSLTNCPLSVGL